MHKVHKFPPSQVRRGECSLLSSPFPLQKRGLEIPASITLPYNLWFFSSIFLLAPSAPTDGSSAGIFNPSATSVVPSLLHYWFLDSYYSFHCETSYDPGHWSPTYYKLRKRRLLAIGNWVGAGMKKRSTATWSGLKRWFKGRDCRVKRKSRCLYSTGNKT